MKTLILLRHGQSVWNLANRFTGWTDVELSEKGREEARQAGLSIRKAGLTPGFFFTSYLKRAIHTLQIAAEAMDREWVPVIKDWHLNERHYGALQGLNKSETAEKYGDEQVHIWRRSYDVEPPTLKREDLRYPGNEDKYNSLSEEELPLTESLKTTIDRVMPCWEELILPKLNLYGTVLVAAHGNSLRALAMKLLHLSKDEIPGLEIPTGRPWVFELDDRDNVVKNYYL
ncbi:MAG: 2,3-diphosphoglycerate-dependent phosphoglycerate mutase [Prevotella sp.]|nr:2,3-diphosphoglycerate-dependent phosphoglycerate mutase [Bacteroides sp.]MCM1366918.1 2,3-diphosphoglycerate-dependent phosphoglycerate mutase [Prevotella sp.]